MSTYAPPDRNTTAVEEPTHSHLIPCRVPADLYEWLRLRGFLAHCSMNSIALSAIVDYRAEVEGDRTSPPTRRSPSAGETTMYNLRVGDELYEWLRVTAFHARTSIKAQVVAALIQAQAQATHAEEAATTDA